MPTENTAAAVLDALAPTTFDRRVTPGSRGHMTSIKISFVSAACLALLVSGCDSTKSAQAKPKPTATTAAPAPAPAPAPKPEQAAKPERPQHIDTKLTDARRDKIDKAHPEAKGFLVMADLQDKLKKNKALKAKDKAMSAFDAMAKGKWVLFTGPLTDENDKGFSLGVTYTPRQKGDIMGMSRQFFLVNLTDVKGYGGADSMKAGTMVVVLAKYEGKGKAGPGWELVSEGNW